MSLSPIPAVVSGLQTFDFVARSLLRMDALFTASLFFDPDRGIVCLGLRAKYGLAEGTEILFFN
jgi:hypothetical protein